MSKILDLVNVLDKSIYSPLLIADPCFVQVRNDYKDTLTFVAMTKEIDIESATGEEMGYLILLAKKEVFMRLAVSVAPEFNVEAEFTKLLKSDRFTHYMKLVETVQTDITSAESSFSIRVGQLIIDGRDGTKRNYELSLPQTILPVFSVFGDHIDIVWNVFNRYDCGNFSCYKVQYGKQSFYDPFEDEVIDSSKVEGDYIITDIHKSFVRLKNLSPQTDYFILITFVGANGRKSYSYTTQTTL